MFQVIIEWRGSSYATGIGSDSTQSYTDADGVRADFIPAQVQVTSFQPVFKTLPSDEESGGLKDIFKRKSTKRTLSDGRSCIYYMAPEAWRSSKNGAPCGIAQRSISVDVPFEAIQKLSTISQRTGMAIDLTKQGQSDICEAFHAKSGIFADDSDDGGVIDSLKSIDENDSRAQKLIDKVQPVRKPPIS